MLGRPMVNVRMLDGRVVAMVLMLLGTQIMAF